MAVFYALWHADMRNFHVLNEALTILLPKTCAAATIKDYRPISLIHVVGKLIAKVLGTQVRTTTGSVGASQPKHIY
jgi:hypothetical protein